MNESLKTSSISDGINLSHIRSDDNLCLDTKSRVLDRHLFTAIFAFILSVMVFYCLIVAYPTGRVVIEFNRYNEFIPELILLFLLTIICFIGLINEIRGQLQSN